MEIGTHLKYLFPVSKDSGIRNSMYALSLVHFPICIKDPLVILICVLEAFLRILTKVDWNGGLRIAWLLFHFSMRIIHSSQSLQMISIYPCDHSFGLWYFGVFSLLGVEEIPAPEWMLDFIVFRLVCNRVAFWVLTE